MALLDTPKAPEELHSRIVAMLISFFMTLYALFYSMASRVTKKLPEISSSDCIQHTQEFVVDATNKEESIPSTQTPKFAETELLSSVLQRLVELEDKLATLKEKPSEMPYEKEELLNAAVCRVDALEAELIATKKVISFGSILFCFLKFVNVAINFIVAYSQRDIASFVLLFEKQLNTIQSDRLCWSNLYI